MLLFRSILWTLKSLQRLKTGETAISESATGASTSPERGNIRLLELPMELLIEIMIHLDRLIRLEIENSQDPVQSNFKSFRNLLFPLKLIYTSAVVRIVTQPC
jgi:hypothetical protein